VQTIYKIKTGLSPHFQRLAFWQFNTPPEWAIPFNIRTPPPVEEQWNSSGVRDKSGGTLQG